MKLTINNQQYEVKKTEQGAWVVERMAEILECVKSEGWTDSLSLMFGLAFQYGEQEGHLVLVG